MSDEELPWVDPDEFAAMQNDAIPAAVDWTARADIVALQGQMQIVTRFLSEQFPNEWGTPPADERHRCNVCGWKHPSGYCCHDDCERFTPPADEEQT